MVSKNGREEVLVGIGRLVHIPITVAHAEVLFQFQLDAFTNGQVYIRTNKHTHTRINARTFACTVTRTPTHLETLTQT